MTTGYADELANLPDHYWRDEDLPAFMEHASPFIMRYCRNRLTRDDDLIGDFYVHFYERAARCLERYISRQHIPFTGYFATYLRHEFLNYARSVRDTRYFESPVDDLHEWSRLTQPDVLGKPKSNNRVVGSSERPDEEDLTDAAQVADLAEAVAGLEPEVRLALKLYHGMELHMADLQRLTELSASPQAAAELVCEFRARLQQRRARLRKIEDRSAYLNYLIHRRPDDAPAVRRWSRWKQRLRETLARDRGLMSTSEIGALFRVSKSTVARRLARARKFLEENRTQPPEEADEFGS